MALGQAIQRGPGQAAGDGDGGHGAGFWLARPGYVGTMESEDQTVDTEQAPNEEVEASVEEFENDPARNPQDEDAKRLQGG